MNFKLNIQLFGNAVIPYNEGRNGKRSIDGLWEQEFNVAKALTAAIGCEFGSVLNIQDAGQKEQGKVYLDKNNGKLYKCLNTTTSVSNTTENFTLFNLQQSSDRLDNLLRKQKRIPLLNFTEFTIVPSQITKVCGPIPDDISIVEVIMARVEFTSERLVFVVGRNSSVNLPFFSGGGLFYPFRALFDSTGVYVTHWSSTASPKMIVGVFYRS